MLILENWHGEGDWRFEASTRVSENEDEELKLFEWDKCSSKEEIKLIKKSIKNHLLELSVQQNSTHFIQKLIGMCSADAKVWQSW